MAKPASNNPLQQIVYNGTCFVFTKTRHFKLPLSKALAPQNLCSGIPLNVIVICQCKSPPRFLKYIKL